MKNFNLTNLKEKVSDLPMNASSEQLLAIILAWMRQNEKITESKEFKDYGLGIFLNINEYNYPIGISNDSINRDYIYNVLNLKNISKLETFLMFLRDILYVLIYFKVEKLCPNCGCGEAFVLKSKLAGKYYYECSQCGRVFNDKDERVEIDEFIYLTAQDTIEYRSLYG